jgi:hypothetical protein
MSSSSILEQIDYLKFHESYNDESPINARLQDILQQQISSEYMEQIIDAILHTRDINLGRGLRDLTYSYLFTLQQFFPIKTVFSLYMMVDGKIGSWRDVRSYCEFVSKHSEKGLNDPIIKPIIGLYNNQLAKDNKIWQETIEAYTEDGTNARPHARHYISYAAKWVPRESKGRNWMFDILVLMWIYRDPEYKSIMESAKTDDEILTAKRKCKMMYRKMVSNLNKELDIQDIDDIEDIEDTEDTADLDKSLI